MILLSEFIQVTETDEQMKSRRVSSTVFEDVASTGSIVCFTQNFLWKKTDPHPVIHKQQLCLCKPP